MTKHGFKDATTNPRRVSAWWRRWPEANIGLPTGGTGFDVLDVDVYASGSGFPAFNTARRAGLVDGWLFLVRTPSGGLHAYYPTDGERHQESWSLAAAHVDFRGEGGYVIAPPSQIVTDTGARRYEAIATGRQPRPLAAAAVRNLLAPDRGPRRLRQRTQAVEDDGRLAHWVANQAEGNRNSALFWAACRFAEHGLPEHDAVAALGPAGEQSGLPAREIEATIRSAYRRVVDVEPARPAVPQHACRDCWR